jgi:hypothetical protein
MDGAVNDLRCLREKEERRNNDHRADKTPYHSTRGALAAQAQVLPHDITNGKVAKEQREKCQQRGHSAEVRGVPHCHLTVRLRCRNRGMAAEEVLKIEVERH